MTVEIHVNKEPFITKGTRTVTKGWHEAYGPYATFEEVTLPKMAQGDLVVVKSIDMTQKETKPPKRYTAASVIKELEKNNLGTKSTRATIVDNLYDRGYVDDKSIQVTQLGMKTCETLEKYCPTILDVELTRQIEEEMEDIRQKKNTPEKVLDHARVVLTTVLAEFKLKEKDIGIELLSANRESQDIASFIGNGPDGNGYKLLKGKFGPFIGSVNYPTDTTTFKLPPGYFKPTNEVCEHCKFPTILKINRGKAPQKYCFNPACSAKKEIAAPTDKTGKVDGEGNVCPKCGTGTMVLRTSLYGQFLGCNAYPKCKNILKIGQKYVAPVAGAAVSAPAKKAVVKKVTVKSAVKKK
jgi:DNA topoisomerase-1